MTEYDLPDKFLWWKPSWDLSSFLQRYSSQSNIYIFSGFCQTAQMGLWRPGSGLMTSSCRQATKYVNQLWSSPSSIFLWGQSFWIYATHLSGQSEPGENQERVESTTRSSVWDDWENFRNISQTKPVALRNSVCFPVLFASDDEECPFLSPTSVSSVRLSRAPVLSNLSKCQQPSGRQQGEEWGERESIVMLHHRGVVWVWVRLLETTIRDSSWHLHQLTHPARWPVLVSTRSNISVCSDGQPSHWGTGGLCLLLSQWCRAGGGQRGILGQLLSLQIKVWDVSCRSLHSAPSWGGRYLAWASWPLSSTPPVTSRTRSTESLWTGHSLLI